MGGGGRGRGEVEEAMGGWLEKINKQALKTIQKDYEYLTKMKKMDEEISEKTRKRKMREEGGGGEEEEGKEGGEKKKGLVMTDVVPVAGLVMGRFYVLECENKTALEIWDRGNYCVYLHLTMYL